MSWRRARAGHKPMVGYKGHLLKPCNCNIMGARCCHAWHRRPRARLLTNRQSSLLGKPNQNMVIQWKSCVIKLVFPVNLTEWSIKVHKCVHRPHFSSILNFACLKCDYASNFHSWQLVAAMPMQLVGFFLLWNFVLLSPIPALGDYHSNCTVGDSPGKLH